MRRRGSWRHEHLRVRSIAGPAHAALRPVRLRVPPVLPGLRHLRRRHRAAVVVPLRTCRHPVRRAAGHVLARARDVVRLRDGGGGGIPAHCGAELDRRTWLRRTTTHFHGVPVVGGTYRHGRRGRRAFLADGHRGALTTAGAAGDAGASHPSRTQPQSAHPRRGHVAVAHRRRIRVCAGQGRFRACSGQHPRRDRSGARAGRRHRRAHRASVHRQRLAPPRQRRGAGVTRLG